MKNINTMEQNTQLMCTKEEFVETTDENDGTVLIVIDESTHTVYNYYIAYRGHWNVL